MPFEEIGEGSGAMSIVQYDLACRAYPVFQDSG
jgi:hypothetical protein